MRASEHRAPAAVALRLVGFGDDAEPVAVRVNEDDKVDVRAALAFVAGRTEAEQPLDLRRLINGNVQAAG